MFFANGKLLDFDELPKSKRQEQRTFPSEFILFMTQIVTNYKGFIRTLPRFEYYVRENHENQLKIVLLTSSPRK